MIDYDYHHILMIREKIKLYNYLKMAFKEEWQLCQDQILGKWDRHYIITGEARVMKYKAHAELLAQYVRIEKLVIQVAI